MPCTVIAASTPARQPRNHRRIQVAQVADAKRFSGLRTQPACDSDLEALACDGAHCFGIEARAQLDGRNRNRARRGNAAMKQHGFLAAPAFDGGMHRAREQRVARNDLVEAFEKQQFQRRFDPEQQVLRRRAAELVVAERGLAALPVPVKARRGIFCGYRARTGVHGDEPQARRRHQPLLRSADGNVHAQLVHRKRRGPERGDHVDHEQGRMARRVDRRAQGAQIVRRAARGIGVHGEDRDNLALGVRAQGFFDVAGVDGIAFAERRADDAAPRGFGLYRPRLGEMPGAGHQYRLAGCDQVLDRRFPRPVAVGSEHEDLGLGRPEQPLDAGFDRFDRFAQARVAMVQRLAMHGIEHFGGHVRGTGGVEGAVAGDADHGC